jgi:hypothetical protein
VQLIVGWWRHDDQLVVMTSTDLIAVSSSVLEGGGYQRIEAFQGWNTTSTRLFEDKYNVVGIAVFTNSAELLGSWADLQGSLVDVISSHVGQTESKSWDGYLVLLTAGSASSGDAEIEQLRHDTTRLRKLVATGGDLSNAGDVERILRSLLPLRTAPVLMGRDTALDMLGEILAEQGVEKETTAALVKSFIQQEPLMEALHRQWKVK